MAQDSNEYLAAHVLNEQQFVSYRSLSRALKVHSNLAKQMLYEFHRQQNARESGTVHATYLVSGIRRIEVLSQTNGTHGRDGEDTVMQSSPPLPSSSAPKADETLEAPSAVRSVMLVKEEHLEQAKSKFESITSIHIYSLEARGVSDIQALSDCNRKIAVEYASEDPLQEWKQYGTVQNPNAKRRARKTALPPARLEKDAEAKAKPFATTAKAKEAETKVEVKPNTNKSTPEPEKKGIPKPVQAKRQNSDIFRSFAKGKTKAKEDSQGSTADSPPPQPEDEPMGGFSDEDDDDTGIDAFEAQQPELAAPTGKSKKDRQAELQAMMDQDDEPMEEAPSPSEQAEQPTADSGKAETPLEDEPKETITIENGRRRGKRRIIKKKKVKDEEGYLVTIEEPAWESFSEEEPEPKKIKSLPAASSTTTGRPTAKKGAKPGQGNIMSFFGKK